MQMPVCVETADVRLHVGGWVGAAVSEKSCMGATCILCMVKAKFVKKCKRCPVILFFIHQ